LGVGLVMEVREREHVLDVRLARDGVEARAQGRRRRLAARQHGEALALRPPLGDPLMQKDAHDLPPSACGAWGASAGRNVAATRRPNSKSLARSAPERTSSTA